MQIKSLFASPVGRGGKAFLEKIISTFGHEYFDYLIFVYDDTAFLEDIFQHCKIIFEAGQKWHFAKKYLTPDYCKRYEYIFFWDDDIDIADFDIRAFLRICRDYKLDACQPALQEGSYSSHMVTLKKPGVEIGRYTDFIEIMIPAYTAESWAKLWPIIESDFNFSGWGYDLIFTYICNFKRLGIIDSQCVIHTRPVQSFSIAGVIDDFFEFRFKHLIWYRWAKGIDLGEIGKLSATELHELMKKSQSGMLFRHLTSEVWIILKRVFRKRLRRLSRFL